MRLTQFANRFGTDKGTVAGEAHAYTTFYEILFAPLRERPIDLLEIGLSIGGPELGNTPDRKVIDAPSVRMWHEYFPSARIYGLDISDFSAFETDWFKFFRADCGNAAELQQVSHSGLALDIIVDDGSHASFHQQLTFRELFRTLKSGGLYIIEDLHWQPKDYERALPQVSKTADLFADLLERGASAIADWPDAAAWGEVADSIANIVLLNENQLLAMRRFHNGNRAPPGIPHYYDKPWRQRLATRGHARRILEAARGLARAVAAADGMQAGGKIKLAVIQRA